MPREGGLAVVVLIRCSAADLQQVPCFSLAGLLMRLQFPDVYLRVPRLRYCVGLLASLYKPVLPR